MVHAGAFDLAAAMALQAVREVKELLPHRIGAESAVPSCSPLHSRLLAIPIDHPQNARKFGIELAPKALGSARGE